jgi:acetyl-CoA carboxylase carboxyltransferase component
VTESLALEIRQGVPGEVTAGLFDLDGRSVILIRADTPTRMGALTPEDGKTIANALEMALAKRLPAILLLASSGADANHGVAALHGWGTAARVLSKCSGVIPVIAAVTGPAVSGTALLIGLADIVVMTESAYAFVSGPIPVRQMTGVQISQQELGGAHVHHRETGVASIIVSDNEVLQTIAEILQFFPNYNGLEAPRIATNDLDSRLTPEASDVLPETPSGSYDVREIIRHIADDNYFVELRSGWAPNLVTGLASFGGRSVGVVANQPISIAGTLDIPASQKGARFVAMCDAFNLPLITLVDTPGFYPGKDLEWRGMIRHGAQLAFAYARATVPRIAVVLRKSYGGAFIVMDSKTIGNDAYLAWPTAEIAVMGATQAAQILRRGASDAEIEEYVTEYDSTYLNPYIGAERGFVDAVIDPKLTRRELIDLLDLLSTKKEKIPVRRHDNSPL